MCLQAALQRFQALLDREPQLAGQIGNEQIKTRAASQVLWVSHLRQAGNQGSWAWQVNVKALPYLAASVCASCKREP